MTASSDPAAGHLAIGGIVLCGGRSSRMGQPKALLPVAGEVMLQRVVRRLSEVVAPIVVVAVEGQPLPTLDAIIVRDPVEYRGPLAGLAAGLAALQDQVDAVYLSGCDVPLLGPQFVSAVIAQLGQADIAVPRDESFPHPLAAVYRTSVLPRVEELLRAQQLRPVFLFDRCRTVQVPCDHLRSADPDLESLINTNTPGEFARVLTRVAVQDRELPLTTYIPGVTARPDHESPGESLSLPMSSSEAIPWRESEENLWGRRLFHHGYYWEAHEAWEGLWNKLGRSGPQADWIKGCIKLAAAGVKLLEGNQAGALRHLARGVELLEQAQAQLPELQNPGRIRDLRDFLRQVQLSPPDLASGRKGQPEVLLPWLP